MALRIQARRVGRALGHLDQIDRRPKRSSVGKRAATSSTKWRLFLFPTQTMLTSPDDGTHHWSEYTQTPGGHDLYSGRNETTRPPASGRVDLPRARGPGENRYCLVLPISFCPRGPCCIRGNPLRQRACHGPAPQWSKRRGTSGGTGKGTGIVAHRSRPDASAGRTANGKFPFVPGSETFRKDHRYVSAE